AECAKDREQLGTVGFLKNREFASSRAGPGCKHVHLPTRTGGENRLTRRRNFFRQTGRETCSGRFGFVVSPAQQKNSIRPKPGLQSFTSSRPNGRRLETLAWRETNESQ